MSTPAWAIEHLYRRAGFGASPAQVAALEALDLPSIVDRLVDAPVEPLPAPPAVLDEGMDRYRRWVAMTWAWLDRMRTTETPLVEKMTLFWHGHFCSSLDAVESIPMMWEQNQLFRSRGLGSFRDLAQAVAVDPAMLRYLDNVANVAGAPNENFAREVMELFTLGVNQYSQDDVVAAARAWTGHTLDKQGRYLFRPEKHDKGQKTFLGTTRNWDGPETLDEILLGAGRDTAARFLVRKLWSFFAYPDPEQQLVDELAFFYLLGGLDVRNLLRVMFQRPEFYSERAVRGLVRTPVEWVVAAMKGAGFGCDTAHPEWWLDQMGQRPFFPPSVAGWKQNGYWLSASAQWGKFAFASFVRWKAADRGLLADSRRHPPQEAARRALAQFGVRAPAQTTVDTIAAYVQTERVTTKWAEQNNVILLALLSPDVQVA